MNTKEALTNLLTAVENENYNLKEEIVMLTMQRDKLLKQVETQKDVPKEHTRDQTYAIGQRFRSQRVDGSYGAETYLLAQTGAGEVNLIGLTHGNRWSNPLKVAEVERVSKRAFDKAFVSDVAPTWVFVSGVAPTWVMVS